MPDQNALASNSGLLTWKLEVGSWGGSTKSPEMPGQNALASNSELLTWKLEARSWKLGRVY